MATTDIGVFACLLAQHRNDLLFREPQSLHRPVFKVPDSSFRRRNTGGSDLVFTTTGTTPISGFGRVKERLDGVMGVSDWRFHDLRRTAASGMARIGVAPHVVEKVLNHVSGQISGVAAVYNRHGYDAEKREALERWAEHVGEDSRQRNSLRLAINSRPNSSRMVPARPQPVG